MTKTLADVGESGLIDRIHRLIQKEGVSGTGVIDRHSNFLFFELTIFSKFHQIFTL